MNVSWEVLCPVEMSADEQRGGLYACLGDGEEVWEFVFLGLGRRKPLLPKYCITVRHV